MFVVVLRCELSCKWTTLEEGKMYRHYDSASLWSMFMKTVPMMIVKIYKSQSTMFETEQTRLHIDIKFD